MAVDPAAARSSESAFRLPADVDVLTPDQLRG